MSDNESQYINLQVRKWRAITYNYDLLSLYGDDTKLYCLTDFQVAWLLSNTDYYRWATRWENNPSTQYELDTQKADLEYNLMNCFDLDIGQVNYIYDATQQAQRQRYSDLYSIGGIPDLNANTPTDFYDGDGSTERIDALCMACDTYVRSIIDSWAKQVKLALTALNFSAFAVSFVPYIGRIAALAIKALALASQVAVDAASDQSAVDDVVCCMYNSLIGSAVSEANFQNSLDACFFDVGSNAAILRDIVAADLDDFQNWLAFLNALGDSYIYMLAGVVFDCPCTITPTWDHYFDFTSGQEGFSIYNTGLISGTRGIYSAGLGFDASNNRSGAYRRSVDIRQSFTTRTITQMILTYDLVKGSYNAVENGIELRASGVGIVLANNSGSFVNGTDLTLDTGAMSQPATELQIGIVTSRQSTASYSGSARIKSLYVTGLGSDPF